MKGISSTQDNLSVKVQYPIKNGLLPWYLSFGSFFVILFRQLSARRYHRPFWPRITNARLSSTTRLVLEGLLWLTKSFGGSSTLLKTRGPARTRRRTAVSVAVSEANPIRREWPKRNSNWYVQCHSNCPEYCGSDFIFALHIRTCSPVLVVLALMH